MGSGELCRQGKGTSQNFSASLHGDRKLLVEKTGQAHSHTPTDPQNPRGTLVHDRRVVSGYGPNGSSTSPYIMYMLAPLTVMTAEQKVK